MKNPEKIEEETKTEDGDWRDYLHNIADCVEKNDPNQLEDLLREPHPIMPGEKEAYDWLKENLGREPRLKLDKTGEHVISAEQEEES